MIEPLSSKNGAVVIGDYNKPTHFFSRANEPKLGHQIVYQLGKIGLDVPGCYDVLISNMSEESFGQIDTPDSDHNLVYANFVYKPLCSLYYTVLELLILLRKRFFM